MNGKKLPLDKAISIKKLDLSAGRTLVAERTARRPFWDAATSQIAEKLPSLLTVVNGTKIDHVPDSRIRTPIFPKVAWPQLDWTGTTTAKNLEHARQVPPVSPTKQFCARHLQIFPNENQRKWLEQAFGNSRYIYNKCVDYLAANPTWAPTGVGEQELRDKLLPKYDTLSVADKEYFLKITPQDTLQRTISKFVSNRKSAATNIMRGHIKSSEPKLMDKKNAYQWIGVRKISLTGLRLCKTFLDDCELRMKSRDRRWYMRNAVGAKRHPLHDFTIHRNGNVYYLNISIAREPTLNAASDRIVALDPGTRTFQTFYDSTCVHGKLADEFTDRFDRLFRRIDATANVRKARQRCQKLRAKVSNIVRDMHWKVAKYLTDNYACIIIPIFKTKDMVTRRGRVIVSPTARKLQTLSHFTFRQRLAHACKMRNRQLIVVSESYTTKTCNECGNIRVVGTNDTYECYACEMDFDRDYNAAKNILAKTLRHYYG